MKQQDIAQQLGGMINQAQSIYSSNISADDCIPSELEEPAPIFEIDYDDEQSKFKADAYKTIEIIVKSVVPKSYLNNPMLQNKMQLDAEQLGMLYYQQKLNDVALRRTMDITAAGNTDPKIFVTIEKFINRMSKLTEQITDLQNQFRKYYIDSYLDLESKDRADEEDELNVVRRHLTNNVIENQIEASVVDVVPDVMVTDNGNVRFSNNKSLLKALTDKKKEAHLKAKKETDEMSEESYSN